MSRAIYFDIQFGSSGDMLVGSLLDLGLDHGKLISELEKLGLEGWSMEPQRLVKYSISGISAHITTSEGDEERNLEDIREIIEGSALSSSAKESIMKVFTRLAAAEAAVHGSRADEVHFHEIGAVDSIVDIAAVCAGLELLGVEKILFGDFCFGTGSVSSRHGELPEPVPAVVELTRDFRARFTGRAGEQITPTAAAILTALGEQIDSTSSGRILASGIGFGARDYGYPGYTRAILLEKAFTGADEVFQIECNIDDMNPQIYPHLLELLLENGALDAYTTPIAMKKGRPGTLLSVIAPAEHVDRIRELVYRETTSLGMRLFRVVREKLERRFETARVLDGEVRIKTGYLNDELVNIQPEFEDCREIARRTKTPLKEVIRRALERYMRKDS